MSIKNNRVFGLAVPVSLTDVVNRRTALRNLGINQEDLEIIRGISDAGFDSDDLQTISRLDEPIWKLFDRYTSDVDTYNDSLTLSGGADFQLRGNLTVAGGLSATAFRYKVLDTDFGGSTPVLKWGDISTSRVSSWSTIGSTISYGADVSISGKLKVGKIKTRATASRKVFNSEIPTHKIKIDLGVLTDTGDPTIPAGQRDIRYIYAMKGIPLRFKSFFRNFDASIGFVPDDNGNKVSWRIYRTDGIGGDQDFPDFGEDTSSRLQYTSPFSAERVIEIYYSPTKITSLSIPNNNIRELPKVVLSNLKIFIFDNNGLTDFPDFNEFSPSLETLSINNNQFFNSSISDERRLNANITAKLPNTLKSLSIRGSFKGGIEQGIFVPFANLQTLNIQRSGSPYFYPDSTNVDGELPFFAQGSLRTFNANVNDFRSFGSPGAGQFTVKTITSLVNLNLSNNPRLIDNNFSIASQNIETVSISRTGLRCPNLQNRSVLSSIDARANTNFGSFYIGWDGTDPDPGVSDANYVFAGCQSLTAIDLESSSVSGYIPKFANNSNLQRIDLRRCNGLIAGRPGLPPGESPKCLYEDTFQDSTNVSTFLLSVDNENFAGPIDPNTFTPVKDTLSVLYLFGAGRFTGNFPDLSAAISLTDVRSDGQGWTGNVPSFASAFNLRRIQLQNNNFTGTLEYIQKTSLNYINYESNNITLISQTSDLPGLLELFLSSNSLSGNLPDFTEICPNVEILSLNNNNYTGYVSGFAGLSRLRQLDISVNNLSEQSVNNILFDLVDNYKAFPRRGVSVNLRGGNNSAPTPFPTISGIISSLTDPADPTIVNGNITSLGSVGGSVPAGYFPVSQTYPSVSLAYNGAAGDGVGAFATVQVAVDTTERIVTALAETFTSPGNPARAYTASINSIFTDSGTKSSGSGAQIQVESNINGEITVISLVSGGSGYQIGDTIVISASDLGYSGPENYDLEVGVVDVQLTFYNSATYTITQINNGGSGFLSGETLRTPNIIQFQNSAGDIALGNIFFDVDGITQRQNTAVFTGFAAAELLRQVGWSIGVNS
jgi:hypothetical protein